MTTSKNLNDIQVGDVVLAMGDKTFTEPLTVISVDRFNPKTKKMGSGDVVCVKLNGGRFWPMQPGIASRTLITVAV
jgi:hypothetical protein